MFPGSLASSIGHILTLISFSFAQVPGTAPFGARSGSTRTISGVTVAGVSATELIDYVSNTSNCGMYIAHVPTGTTGNVSVTFSGSMVRAGVGIWAITGLNSATPIDVAQSNTLSVSIDVVSGGVAAAVGYNHSTSTQTWTGLDKDFQVNITDNVNAAVGGASFQVSADQLNRNVTMNVSNKDLPALCAVSLR